VRSVDKISENGDSGALLVHDAHNVVGICIGGSELIFGSALVASPIRRVLNELGVTFNAK
jgi:hypothetical protein